MVGTGFRELELIPEAQCLRVLYSTDRKPTGNLGEPRKFFGVERNVVEGRGELSFGSSMVCLPKDRSLARLMKIDPLDETSFFAELTDQLKKPGSEALLFIHGYNVGFAEAAERAAQLAVELDFQGVPIVYSWPSRRKWARYCADEATVGWSTKHFKDFLLRLLEACVEGKIHLIAHSMGNRALVQALDDLHDQSDACGSKLRQVVFAAPDVDRDTFVELVRNFSTDAERLTLYGSSKDLAIKASKIFHLYHRAGEAGKAMTLVKGVDSIDATKAETDLLGHSYYCRPSILEDLSELVVEGTAPAHREGLIPNRKWPYWIYDPAKARSTSPSQEGEKFTT